MKDGVRILNLSRADLVNDDDIAAALESGKVAKYVTDFPNEKTLAMKNAIPIPHLCLLYTSGLKFTFAHADAAFDTFILINDMLVFNRAGNGVDRTIPVSYTHLDVYKRQKAG